MKRLNVKLVVSLLAGVFFFAVLIHFVHGFQVERNADSLRERAQTNLAQGKDKEAVDLLTQYLRHRPDDRESYEQLSKLVGKVLLSTDRSTKIEDVRKALAVLQSALLKFPDLKDARMCLARVRIRQQGFADALVHIEYLQKDLQVKDIELDIMYAQIKARTDKVDDAIKRLKAAVGYNEETKEIDPEIEAAAKDHPEAYRLLADLLRRKEDTKSADAFMNRLVKVNPQSAEAYVQRAQYQQTRGKLAEARKDWEKALQCDPDNIDAVLGLSDVMTSEKNYDGAQRLLEAALAKNPKNERLYAVLAAISLTPQGGDAKEQIAKAEGYIAQGLANVPDGPALHFLRANLQLQTGDVEGVKKTLSKMRELGIRQDVIELVEARVLMLKSKWQDASRLLERAAPQLAMGYRGEAAQAYVLLGACYEALGAADKAFDPYNMALKLSPNNASAKLGLSRVQLAMGKRRESLETVKSVGNEDKENSQLSLIRLNSELQLAVNDQMQVPAENRDWSTVDRLVEQVVQDTSINPFAGRLLQAKLSMIKGDLPTARKQLSALKESHAKEIGLWTTFLELVQQEDQYDQIPLVLAEMRQAIGNVAAVRINQISWDSQQTDEQSAERLKQQEQDLATLENKNDQTAVWQALAEAYSRRNDYPNLRRCYLQVAEVVKNPQIWQTLFDMAQVNDNEEHMEEAIKRIGELEGESDSKKFAEISRAVWQIAKGRADKKLLPELNRRIETLQKSRPRWSELERLEGSIAELMGDPDQAIGHYRSSLEFGKPHPGVARRLVMLYYTKGRINDAAEAMPYVGSIPPGDPLWKMSIELLHRTGKTDFALRRVNFAVSGEPPAADLVYYGGFYVRTDHKDEAEKAFRRAVEAQPDLSEGWLVLIEFLVKEGKQEDAAAALRQARGALGEDKAAVTLALGEEMLGEFDAAEEHYRSAIAKAPDDALLKRQICTFFGRRSQLDKAAPYIEELMKLELEPGEKGYESLAWARRTKAKLIADQGGFQHLQQAARLIDENAVDGKLPPEDLLMLASLFGARPEAALRGNAVHLLEELEKVRRLTPEESLALAQLYERDDKWSKSKERMTELLASVGNNPLVLSTYTRLLLKHGDIGDAEGMLKQLEEANGDPQTLKELRAWLLVSQDKGPEGAAELLSTLPKELTDAHLPTVEGMVAILEELGQTDAAEKLLRDYCADHPRGLLALAAYLGRRGNFDEAFELAEQARESHPLGRVIQAALDSTRRYPDRANERYFKIVEDWLNKGLADEPQSSEFQLQTADLRDQQGQYDAVESEYRAFLAREDSDPWQRAYIKNNLAFVLAMRKQNTGDEALKLVNEAMDVLGQTSDLLDTRAIVYYSLGQMPEAIADSEAAVRDTQSAPKYFHLALIQDKAGNASQAKSALKSAVELKLAPGQLPRLEHKVYEQLFSRVRLN